MRGSVKAIRDELVVDWSLDIGQRGCKSWLGRCRLDFGGRWLVSPPIVPSLSCLGTKFVLVVDHKALLYLVNKPGLTEFD